MKKVKTLQQIKIWFLNKIPLYWSEKGGKDPVIWTKYFSLAAAEASYERIKFDLTTDLKRCEYHYNKCPIPSKAEEYEDELWQCREFWEWLTT